MKTNVLTLVGYTKSYENLIGAEKIKATVGDSVTNNRTLTVNQMVRYLNRKNSSTNQRAVGQALRSVYKMPVVREQLRYNRENNCRTDSYDLNELCTALFEVRHTAAFNWDSPIDLWLLGTTL
jgi:hypothetical protein